MLADGGARAKGYGYANAMPPLSAKLGRTRGYMVIMQANRWRLILAISTCRPDIQDARSNEMVRPYCSERELLRR